MSERLRKAIAIALTSGLTVVVVFGFILGDRTNADRARDIGRRVRCPVCRGVPISDSPSETARAMMDLVEEQIEEGWSDDEILDYFAERYTDSIIIDPPFAGDTLLVWLLPAFAVVAGIFLISTRRKVPAPIPDEVPR